MRLATNGSTKYLASRKQRCLLVCKRSDALSDPEASEEARIDGVVLSLHRPIIWLV